MIGDFSRAWGSKKRRNWKVKNAECFLGAQASLPAMSASARNIEDALPFKLKQLTQPGL
jgi:hypothetical protein